jgi:hypothetical protein
MATSQNGWPVLEAGSPLLHTWVIPAKTGAVRITMRNGSAGFLLAHFLLWFAEKVQPLAGKVADDWGYAYRPIRGQSSGFSNHASGTAADGNAVEHPLGRIGTFQGTKIAAIRRRLRFYGGAIRWGGDYQGRKDEMHYEIVQTLGYCEGLAKRLMRTPRGRRILKANPDQRAVILR